MESYYSPRELRDFSARMADEIEGFDPEMASFHRIALRRLVNLPVLAGYREELLEMIPGELADAVVRGASRPSTGTPESGTAKPVHRRTVGPHEDEDDHLAQSAIDLLNEAARLNRRKRPEDALSVYDEGGSPIRGKRWPSRSRTSRQGAPVQGYRASQSGAESRRCCLPSMKSWNDSAGMNHRRFSSMSPGHLSTRRRRSECGVGQRRRSSPAATQCADSGGAMSPPFAYTPQMHVSSGVSRSMT